MSLSSPPPSPAHHTPEDPATGARPSPELALADALRERRAIIADRSWYERDAEGHLKALMRVSEGIVSHGKALPVPVHPQLKHYLERCSYDKALAFLSGELRDETHTH